MDLLRFATAGSVDDGKSTLIGRLLFDSKQVFEDTLAGLQRASEAQGHDTINLALMTDGLRAEREQGITIDVAYRYFATPRRKFIMADSPGHQQYTRNMVTGASTSNLALILVDARKGVIQQTRRHSVIASLLGIHDMILCVNKMDLVDWSEAVFDEIVDDFGAHAAQLGKIHVTSIPMSALRGDNIVDPSDSMAWYKGPTLLEFLETVEVPEPAADAGMRFPVQYVIRPQTDEFHDYRAYAGTVAGGHIRQGAEVVILPGGQRTKVESIDVYEASLPSANIGDAVAVRIADQVDIGRGHMFADPESPPSVVTRFSGDLCWMSETADLTPGRQFWLRQGTRRVRCVVESLDTKLDVETMISHPEPPSFSLNEIGRVTVKTTEPVCVDPYERNRGTGSFILIDPATHNTVGAGMIRTIPGDGEPEAAYVI
ncbi:MAG: sulfate adenylyltransferase subunit 1 [Tepidiformaceae bacterium]